MFSNQKYSNIPEQENEVLLVRAISNRARSDTARTIATLAIAANEIAAHAIVARVVQMETAIKTHRQLLHRQLANIVWSSAACLTHHTIVCELRHTRIVKPAWWNNDYVVLW